jgi:hypothetical protein
MRKSQSESLHPKIGCMGAEDPSRAFPG